MVAPPGEARGHWLTAGRITALPASTTTRDCSSPSATSRPPRPKHNIALPSRLSGILMRPIDLCICAAALAASVSVAVTGGGTATAQTKVVVPVPFVQCIKNEGAYAARVRWYNDNDHERKAAEATLLIGQSTCYSGTTPAQKPRFAKIMMQGGDGKTFYQGVPTGTVILYGTVFAPSFRAAR